MKVLRGMMASIAVLAAVVGLPAESVRGAEAECPSECRREIAEIMCREVTTTEGDRVTTARYYWSDGAD